MSDVNSLVKLAYDNYKGVVKDFSAEDTMDVLRQGLIEANNGSTKLDIRAIRDGKCSGLFTIIETILQKVQVDELKGNEFFMNFVDYRNIALGDLNEFVIPTDALFAVSDVAEGTQGFRRQRLNAGQKVSVPTQLKPIKVYEELNRVLSGRVDFNEFIATVSTSMKKKSFADIYAAWSGITSATIGSTYYPTAGSYDEDKLLDIVSHVEAASDKVATIIGTKKALRKLTTAVVSDKAKDDLYDVGYYGKFNGTPIVSMRQTHKQGTDIFMLDDSKIYVVVSDMQPIKYVTEGDGMLLMGDPMTKGDLTQEFLYGDRYGVGIVATDKFGIYSMT